MRYVDSTEVLFMLVFLTGAVAGFAVGVKMKDSPYIVEERVSGDVSGEK